MLASSFSLSSAEPPDRLLGGSNRVAGVVPTIDEPIAIVHPDPTWPTWFREESALLHAKVSGRETTQSSSQPF
jgi:hypothetical protein